MTTIPKQEIGPFVVGEKPSALQYTYEDTNGANIDLTGYSAKFIWRERDAVASITRNATIATDPTTGQVSYAWQGDEFATPGHYLAQFWVGNGVIRLASLVIEFYVSSYLGPTPAI